MEHCHKYLCRGCNKRREAVPPVSWWSLDAHSSEICLIHTGRKYFHLGLDDVQLRLISWLCLPFLSNPTIKNHRVGMNCWFHEAYLFASLEDNKGNWELGKDTLSRDWSGKCGGLVKMVFRSFPFLWKESLIEGGQNITDSHSQTGGQENTQRSKSQARWHWQPVSKATISPSDHCSFPCKVS